MNEKSLELQVGIFIIATGCVGLALLAKFGQWERFWKPGYQIVVQLESAAGVYPGVPVHLNGISIGYVKEVKLDEKHGGVAVLTEIRNQFRIPLESQPVLSRSLLGESSLEFHLAGGTAKSFLKPGARIVAVSGGDPMAMIQRLETRTLQSLDAFAGTTQEWQQVAKSLNSIMDTNRGQLDQVVERSAIALDEFTKTMKSTNSMVNEANVLLSDPKTQLALRQTLTALPQLVNETRLTIASTREAVDAANQNMMHLQNLTEPFAKRGEKLATRMESVLTGMDSLVTELDRFARVMNQEDGTLHKLMDDPALYQNLDRSAQSLVVLMKNLDPILKDFREFSDKIARKPELLGVGGAMKPSTGLKDNELLHIDREANSTIRGNIRK